MQNPIKAADAFESWLQGRINVCVTGLNQRIAFLEGKVDAHQTRIDQLEEGEMRDMSLRMVEMFDNQMARFISEGDTDPLLEALKGSAEWEDAVLSVLTEGSGLEDAVKEVIKEELTFEVRVS